jgi:hypothetical protein
MKKVALVPTGGKVFWETGLAHTRIGRTTEGAARGNQPNTPRDQLEATQTHEDEEIQILQEIRGHVYITWSNGIEVITID